MPHEQYNKHSHNISGPEFRSRFSPLLLLLLLLLLLYVFQNRILYIYAHLAFTGETFVLLFLPCLCFYICLQIKIFDLHVTESIRIFM